MTPLGVRLDRMINRSDASPEYHELIREGARWQVCPNFEWVIEAVADEGQFREISAGGGRGIYWHDGGPLPLVIKVFGLHGLRETVRPFGGRSAAHREWAVSQEAYRRHIPVPRPLAFGEIRPRGVLSRAFLVSEGLEGVPLSEYYWTTPGLREKRVLLAEVARAVRQMHDAGLLHPDLHAGNLFFAPGKGVFLLDLHRGRLGEPLSVRQRLRNLAVLASSFDALLSRSDRFRFWRAYVAGRPFWEGPTGRLWTDLHALEVRHRRREWKAKDRRCLRDSRAFLAFQEGEYRGFCQRRHMTPALRELLGTPSRLVDGASCHLLKDSRTTRVTRRALLPGGPELFVKRYNYQGFLYALKDVLRSSRSQRAWIAANGLVARGIPTATPVAYLERRRLGVLLESYLITEEVEGEGLREFARRSRASGASLDEKRQVTREVAALVRRMHEKGVSHRDLKGRNILIRQESPGRFRPFLLDLDGVQFGRAGWQRRARDLARLSWDFRDHPAVTRSDRLRFLLAYLVPKDRPAWKKLWQAVAAAEEHAGWASYTLPPWQRQGEAGS